MLMRPSIGEEIDHIIPRDLVFFIREIWCSPNDSFPYFHTCKCELEHKLRHVQSNHHVGVGALVCQGVKALGHNIKVACPSTDWFPKHSLLSYLASLSGAMPMLKMFLVFYWMVH